MTEQGVLRVQLVHAWPDRCWTLELLLPPESSVGDALVHAAGPLREAGVEVTELGLAVFGRTASLATRLRDGDRIELLRPLQATPREAREGRAAAARRRGA